LFFFCCCCGGGGGGMLRREGEKGTRNIKGRNVETKDDKTDK
jgi:hypothetical protein